MKYVYILRSLRDPRRRYVGAATDLERRLAQHNAGESVHTSKFTPWKVSVVIRFERDDRAEAFERYLKSGSGRAFSKRHLE
jgi:predicted GIY-YIG superfamily endonuclease